MPTTPPVRNAMRVAFSRPPSSRAAEATRMLAAVASRIPRLPIVAENTAPMMKKMERPMRSPMSSAGSAKSRTNTTMTNTPSVRNWRLRYATAPSWTARPISCIFGVPSSAARTSLRRMKPMARAARATTATTPTTMRSFAPSSMPWARAGGSIRPPGSVNYRARERRRHPWRLNNAATAGRRSTGGCSVRECRAVARQWRCSPSPWITIESRSRSTAWPRANRSSAWIVMSS